MFLFPFAFANVGCTGDNTGAVAGPMDTSKTYKNSDEAAKDMMKNSTLPPKKYSRSTTHSDPAPHSSSGAGSFAAAIRGPQSLYSSPGFFHSESFDAKK